MRNRVRLAALSLLIASGAFPIAQSGSLAQVPPPSGLRFASRWPEDAAVAKGIIGTVVDIRQVPVGKVTVQLRDLSTGIVTAVSESNENGEYVFPDVDPGMYVVEMVIAAGSIVALSNAGSLGNNEILQTVIMLPGRWDSATRDIVFAQDFASFFGVSAATSMTAETLTLASQDDIPTADAGEAVSSNSLRP